MNRTLPAITRILFCHTILSLGFVVTAFSQLRFSAVANESKIGLNDVVQIQYKIENANSLQRFNPPSFENFTVVSGPNQETGMSSINGNVTSYAAISYILRPKKPGTFTILSATAVADGKQLRSNPVTIQVLRQNNIAGGSRKSAPQVPFFDEPEPGLVPANDFVLKPGENAESKIRKNLFIKMVANKTSCYVGEPVVVSFNLYTRLRSETNVTDAPSFNGFSVSDMDVNQNATPEKINGKTYSCYVLRKVQLYPLQSGTFTLTPIEATNNVTFLKYGSNTIQSNDPVMQMMQDFGGAVGSAGDYVQKSVSLQSNSLTINVKPLPESNVPATFKGAVGDFGIQTDLDKNQLTTDDAGNLKITIKGKGNFKMVNAPIVHWPAGIDAYDAKVKDQINKQDVPHDGNKIFNIPFTITKAGKYSIPPVDFSWFNPETGMYETKTTEPIAFQVSKGRKPIAGKSNTSNGNTSFLSVPKIEWIGGGILVGGVLIALMLVFLKRKSRESDLETQLKLDDLKSEQPKDDIVPGNPLADLHEKLLSEDADGFYRELKHALESYLSGKLKMPVHALTKETVMERLDACNVGVGTTKLFESLMREIELGLYAKCSHVSQMRNLYEKTADLFSLLNKQIC